VVQLLLVKFDGQIVLQPSKARKWPLCCSIWHWYCQIRPVARISQLGGKKQGGHIFKYNIECLGVQPWNRGHIF